MKRTSYNTRAIVNLSDEQYKKLKAAADRIGLTVPAYIRVKALEATG